MVSKLGAARSGMTKKNLSPGFQTGGGNLEKKPRGYGRFGGGKMQPAVVGRPKNLTTGGLVAGSSSSTAARKPKASKRPW